jgi:16S rRNA (adenine1518-N6/adenine1519-N6)-dimethyltransferase
MPTRLGQNFLRDEKILEKIIQSANLQPDDFIVEIGPGEGGLTEKLADKVKQVIAVEIDKKLIPALQKKFAQNKKIIILNADILKINLKEIVKSFKLQVSSYKVVANIPYYITSSIIRLFLESALPPQEMILMVQKEVAERIVEKPGKMSILALSVQYYAQAQILFSVPAKAFYPIPKVDSAVIKIIPFLNQNNPQETQKFFRVVRAGFSAKRKTLANNLANSFHLDKKDVENKLNPIGLAPLTRAQELSLEDWKKLAENLGI